MEGKKKIKGLYTIIDTSYLSLEDIKRVTEEILEAGAQIIQLRAKDTGSADMLSAAKAVRLITRKHNSIFLVNDRVDIALMAEADGVHIGDEDVPPEEARKLLGTGKMIGYSTHTPEEAEAAHRLSEDNTIDYISYGPVFPTKTKKDARPVAGLKGLKETKRKSPLPVVAIGGITEENLPEVLLAGADAVALISELLQAPDVTAKTKRILNTIKTGGSKG